MKFKDIFLLDIRKYISFKMSIPLNAKRQTATARTSIVNIRSQLKNYLFTLYLEGALRVLQ